MLGLEELKIGGALQGYEEGVCGHSVGIKDKIEYIIGEINQ